MKANKELSDTLKKMFATDDQVFVGYVTAVDKNLCTCSVESDDLEYADVRLKATVKDSKGIKLFPVVGSVVLVQRLGAIEEFFVTMYSEVDEIKYEVDTCLFDIDASGFGISKGGDSVKAILADLLSAIKTLTVTTNVGPSGFPINAAVFTAIENRVNNILK